MNNEERDTRWQALMALQEGLDEDPGIGAKTGGRQASRRTPSPKAARFAEALTVSTTWSGISDARHRRRPAA
jgi:hypothetical protein